MIPKRRIKLEFQNPPSTSYFSSLDYSNQFNNILLKFIETTKPSEDLILMKNYNLRISFFKDFYINGAKMLCNYTPFTSLPFNDKVSSHYHSLIPNHLLFRFFCTTIFGFFLVFWSALIGHANIVGVMKRMRDS